MHVSTARRRNPCLATFHDERPASTEAIRRGSLDSAGDHEQSWATEPTERAEWTTSLAGTVDQTRTPGESEVP